MESPDVILRRGEHPGTNPVYSEILESELIKKLIHHLFPLCVGEVLGSPHISLPWLL